MGQSVLTVHLDAVQMAGLRRLGNGVRPPFLVNEIVLEGARMGAEPACGVRLRRRDADARIILSVEDGVVVAIHLRAGDFSVADCIRGLVNRRLGVRSAATPARGPRRSCPPPGPRWESAAAGSSTGSRGGSRLPPPPPIPSAEDGDDFVDDPASEAELVKTAMRRAPPRCPPARVVDRDHHELPPSSLQAMLEDRTAFIRQQPPVFAAADLLDGRSHLELVSTLSAGQKRRLLIGVDPASRALCPHGFAETNAQLDRVGQIVRSVCIGQTVEVIPTVWWLDGQVGVLMVELVSA